MPLVLALLVVEVGPLGAEEVPRDGIVSPSVLKRMTVEELLAQNVTSVSRRPESWHETAGNVFLMLGQRAHFTGATVLPELLRMAPSLFVAQKSSSEWAVNARGFVRSNGASNKLLVMMDGRTVYSPLFSNVFWESTSMFLPDLERIEVISGPGGASWGANAVNGVISIQSKSARETLGGLAYANTGSVAQGFGGRYGTKFGSTGAARVYVQGAEHDATLTATGTEDGYDRWKTVQTGFRADWGDAAAGELTLQSDVFAGRYRRNVPQLSFDNFNVLGRWSRDLSPDSQLWIRAYHDRTENRTANANHEVSLTTDLEFQHHLKPADNQDLLWGANYRLLEDSITDTVGFTIQPADLKFALGSIFAQHEIELTRAALKLTMGLRFEHNHYSGWEYLPSLRLAWKLPDQLIWIAASRAARIPSRFDSDYFAPASPPYSIVMGGPKFKAEIVHAYELGWRGHPVTGFSLTATAYLHDYDDLRSLEPSGPAVIPITIGNEAAGRSYGLELFADWDVAPWWRMRAGGFVMRQETWLKPGSGDLEKGFGEASFPEYQAQLRNTFYLGRSVTWWTALRQVAAVPASDDGQGVVPGYAEMDTCLTWTLQKGLELSLSGRNLLDAAHPEIGGLAVRREIQRSVQSAIRYKF